MFTHRIQKIKLKLVIEQAPVAELSVMLNKHRGGLAQPSAGDMHKSREGREVQHEYNVEYMGKGQSASLKSSRSHWRTDWTMVGTD